MRSPGAVTLFPKVTLLLPLLLVAEACGSRADGPGTTRYEARRAARPAASPDRFWVGDVGPSDGPLHLGPKQFPFICATVESGLGQPLVDNQDGRGNAVFPEVAGHPDFGASPVGYSEQCGLATRVDYFYWDSAARDFLKFDPATMFASPPPTLQLIEVNGAPAPFVVRVETGTLDRFLYTIAMLAPWPESTASPASLENGAWKIESMVYPFWSYDWSQPAPAEKPLPAPGG